MSKIVEVLKEIVKGNEGTEIFSYRDNFATLWELDKLASDKTYVIVWDDIPPRQQDVVATNKYLTPIDWAVAFSLEVNDKKKDDEKNVRILILDLNSQSVSNADSVRFFNQFPQTMPWVRLYRPFDADKLIKVLRPSDKAEDKVPSMKGTIEKSDMGLIRNVWAAFLTKPSTPGDHHAIANLVGPLLLMGDDTGANQHTKALRSLMKALGLIPQQSKEELLSKDKPWIKWDAQILEKILKKDGKLNLVLIDDQYEQGWGKVLCKAVKAEYTPASSASCEMKEIGNSSDGKIIVKAAASADCLLSRLNGEDQRFNFNICSDPAKDAEILFLDLRLFSGKNEQKEADFFEMLISLAEKFIEDGTNKLPWEGFTSAEIEKVKNWVKPENRKREDDNYATALTLFPRILSLTDLSLPIVIFSSTGRRDIAEILKPYGNIITDFDKPKFTVDMPEDIARQTKKKFEEALEKAVLLLQGRHAIHEVEKASEIRTLNQLPSGDKYVEIFIDESGNVCEGNFVIGGLVLVHNKKEEADALHREMPNTVINDIDGMTCPKNLVWCGPGKLHKRLGTENPKVRVDIIKQILPLVEEVFKKHADLAIPVILQTKVSSSEGLNVLGNEHLDNLYLKLIKDLLDSILYELLPWHLGRQANIRCSIHAGTRRRTKKDNVDFTGEEKTGLHRKFGIKVERETRDRESGPYDYYQALTPTSFIPIVSNIIMGRPNVDVNRLKVESVLGVALNYKDTCPSSNFRHAHSVADLVAHIGYISLRYRFHDVFKDSFKDRIVDQFEDSFKAALDASKHLDADDLVSALLSAYYAQFHHDSEKYPESIIPKILSRVSEKIVNLKGDQFREFAGSLDVWYKNSSVPPRKAQIDSKYPTQQITINQDKRNNSGIAKAHSTSRSNNMSKNNAPRATVLGKSDNPVITNKAPQNVQQAPQADEPGEKKVITVKSSEKLSAGKRYICQQDDGKEVLISCNQTKNSPALRNLKLGDNLKVSINMVDGKSYATDIELMR